MVCLQLINVVNEKNNLKYLQIELFTIFGEFLGRIFRRKILT